MSERTPGSPFPRRVETARLVLRAWQDADLAPFAELNADPSVMEHFPSVLLRAQSDEVAARIRRHWDDHGFGLWAVEVPGQEAFVGFVGLCRPTFEAHFTPCVEVGWRLGRAHWGKGYATEGARAAVAAGFGVLGLREIVSITVPANVRSRHVMHKLGMEHRVADDFDHPKIDRESPLLRHVLYRLGPPRS